MAYTYATELMFVETLFEMLVHLRYELEKLKQLSYISNYFYQNTKHVRAL